MTTKRDSKSRSRMGRTHSRRFVALLACCIAASAVLAGHAWAGLILQESYHFQGSFETANFCGVEGLTVRSDSVADGRVRAVQRGPSGFAYFLDHIKETEVVTNAANGQAVTFVFTGTRKDQTVTDNGDGTQTISTLLTGTQVLYGADGTSIARSSGLSTYEILVDDGGTPTDPFDDEFIAELGPFKAAGRRDDFCAAGVAALTS